MQLNGPGGGPAKRRQSRCHPIDERILKADKSVQANDVHSNEVIPLLHAVGAKGIYTNTSDRTVDEAEKLVKKDG